MRQNRHFSIMKQKSYLTAGVIALVVVIAMAGIYYRGRNAKKEAEQEAIIMAETDTDTDADDKEEVSDAWTSDVLDSAAVSDGEAGEKEQKPEESGDDEEAEKEQSREEETEDEDDDDATEETAAQPAEPELHFSASDGMSWPVSGDVILNYSMDKSVYFATLDQYKYNPAVIISGAVNDRVVAAADGQVISVVPDAETGITVTVGMGDGYQAVYGQLKQVELAPGDYIERGEIIGFINEPTKYYSVEGSNLYFALTKDGKPLDPMDYLE